MPFEGLRFSSPPERWLGGRALSLSFIMIFITILISNQCKTSVSEGVVCKELNTLCQMNDLEVKLVFFTNMS